MGEEFFNKGAHVQLGPAVNVQRVPLDGRNFEYLSGEDPVLGAKLTGPVVHGIQSKGVMANIKHFVDNSQETRRMSVDEHVDERTNFEMYYPPFEAAFKADCGSLMCSYNKINGAYSCQNNQTLNTHLRDYLGFEGFVMSDWGATHSVALKQGLDQEQNFWAHWYKKDALKKESIDDINKSVYRLYYQFFKLGIFDKKRIEQPKKNVTTEAHLNLAKVIAEDSMVLLKNERDALPLQ